MPTLNEELTTGPLAADIAPHIESGNDGAIEAIMNTPRYTVHGSISNPRFKTWVTQSGQRTVVEDTAKDVNDVLRGIALALLDVLHSTDELNLGDENIEQLALIWHGYGKMSTEVKDSLFALAEKQISRAEQLGISVTVQGIAQALRG